MSFGKYFKLFIFTAGWGVENTHIFYLKLCVTAFYVAQIMNTAVFTAGIKHSH